MRVLEVQVEGKAKCENNVKNGNGRTCFFSVLKSDLEGEKSWEVARSIWLNNAARIIEPSFRTHLRTATLCTMSSREKLLLILIPIYKRTTVQYFYRKLSESS